MRFTVSRAATLAASMILVSGCTTVYSGIGVRDPYIDQKVNLSLLDTGNYPTKPSEPLGNAGNLEDGALAEARRMAEVVLVPFEIDPSLTDSSDAARGVTHANSVDSSFFIEDVAVSRAIGDALDSDSLIAGFQDAASSPQTNGLIKLKGVVARFATPEDAKSAVAAMVAGSEHEEKGATFGSDPARRAYPIADHPDLQAFSADSGSRGSVFGYQADGPYALVYFAESAFRDNNVEVAAKLLTAAVDKQLAALKDFTPTPVDKLADLPLDPNGLMARTLPVAKGTSSPNAGVYGPHGALHLMMNPKRSQELFNDAGLTEFVEAGASVYQTRDDSAAAQVADDFVNQISAASFRNYTPDDSVSGLPNTRCLKPEKTDLYPTRCVGTYDKYVIETGAPNGPEARRMFAAQYVMLAAE